MATHYGEMVESVRKTLEETTTSANVAFVPGGFSKVVTALSPLKKMKRHWKINLLTDVLKESYIFDLGGTSVTVPHAHWKQFQNEMQSLGKVRKHEGGFHFEFFSNLMTESRQEVEMTYKQLQSALEACITEEPISEARRILSYFSTVFPTMRSLPSQESSIIYTKELQGVKETVDKAKRFYGDDLGGVEMVVEALNGKTSLAFSEPFSANQYLFRGRLGGKYNGVSLVLDVSVDTNFVPSQRLEVVGGREDLLSDLAQARSDVKYSGAVVYPKGKQFSYGIFSRLKKEIDEKEESLEY